MCPIRIDFMRVSELGSDSAMHHVLDDTSQHLYRGGTPLIITSTNYDDVVVERDSC